MKNKIKVLGVIAVIAILGFTMTACGGDSGGVSGAPGLPGLLDARSITNFAGTALTDKDAMEALFLEFIDTYMVALEDDHITPLWQSLFTGGGGSVMANFYENNKIRKSADFRIVLEPKSHNLSGFEFTGFQNYNIEARGTLANIGVWKIDNEPRVTGNTTFERWDQSLRIRIDPRNLIAGTTQEQANAWTLFIPSGGSGISVKGEISVVNFEEDLTEYKTLYTVPDQAHHDRIGRQEVAISIAIDSEADGTGIKARLAFAYIENTNQRTFEDKWTYAFSDLTFHGNDTNDVAHFIMAEKVPAFLADSTVITALTDTGLTEVEALIVVMTNLFALEDD